MQQYLVFDIETAPVKWESLSESQQEYLVRYCENEEQIQKKKFEMALSPMTALVVCVGLQLMQQNEDGDWEIVSRAAFATDNSLEGKDTNKIDLAGGDPCYISNERKLLEDFWMILTKYKNVHLISFNGRNFDAPFMMLRSAVHHIRPSRNIMTGTKFNYPLHTDLIDELTFFMPQAWGATRRFNFDFYTRVFGISSPKAEGVDGSMVGEMFHNGQIQEIAEYCMRDINATWELFLHWHKYLRF